MYVTLSEYRHATRPTNAHPRHAVGICANAVDDPSLQPLQPHDVVIDGSMTEKAIGEVLRERVGGDVGTPLVVYGDGGVVGKLAHLGWCNVWEVSAFGGGV